MQVTEWHTVIWGRLYTVITTTWHSVRGKTLEVIKRSLVVKDEEGKRGE